jgi:tRNA (guanine37-N1)-methyltransferase
LGRGFLKETETRVMDIAVITLFPEMFQALRCGGISARALERGLCRLSTWNPRDYTYDKHRRVDDRPYGGGPGMVMQVPPLRQAIQAAKQAANAPSRVVYLSPQGCPLNQAGLHRLFAYRNLILVAGRYEGIDERLISHDIDEECSIGDYVLSGGELAAMVMIDALIRLLPGALGDEDSASQDSFYQGLLDYPHYTRPESVDGQKVPAVLLQGNHAEIERWRQKQALGKTWLKRADLLEKLELSPQQRVLLDEFITESK